MRQIVRFLFLFIGIVIPSNLSANGTFCLQPSNADIAEKSYSGFMDVTMSKGKSFKGRPATFILKENILFCDLPKMGKMPGKIRINLPVTVDSKGNISALPHTQAGVMKMPMGVNFKLKLMSLKSARIDQDKISFILEVYGKMMGIKIPTSIFFCGYDKK